MSRRGFFKRVFGGPVKQSMLAVQVVVPVYALTDFRAKLHNVIEGTHHEVHGPDEKRVYYRKIVAVLEQALAHYEYGYWEYLEDDAAADGFHEWVTEIENELALDEEGTGDEADDTFRLDADKRFIAVTVILLVHGPMPNVAELDPEDEDNWTRHAMAERLRDLNRVDFAGLLADAVYLVPGNDQDGFSDMDLADEGWAHLVMLH
ncbi:MAG: hypothetical protein ACI81R_001328 [Bradymonadia bacterium]|jgi:hypothetical protein